ncbi:MAG: Crp/Fnr family transcriptional regulator, partial [Gammaproteobacteria bacterium]|nr:Crp/Fnr family transcriptional regulator [Gammaproteobacteria bacterium]
MTDADFRANRLLAALPAAEYEHLRANLKPVRLEFGATLYRPRQVLRHVYFPLDAVTARIYLGADGSTTSLGVIGREGIVGMAAFLGGQEILSETQVIAAGTALRLAVDSLGREFDRGGALQKELLAFAQAFSAQTGQIAVCNRHHAVDQQLCFWLMLCLERLPGNEMCVTQELLASLIGVRREGVTRAALKLRKLGLLDYKHGRLKVPDPERLKPLACECYHIVHDV